MHIRTRLALPALLVTALAGGAVSPVYADIVVVTGVNNQGTDNVLLTDATDVAVVTGTVNSDLFGVNFISSGGNLNAEASGQAVITAADDNDPFTNIQFFLSDSATFTRAVFNLNAATDGSVIMTVTGININGGFFQDDFVVDANGQNFFTVTAINGQAIYAIDLTAANGATFEDLRQVRIGGAADTPDGNVPEPATLFLLGSGMVATVVARRRRSV